ncbi:hypothetical protein ES288_A01G186300v1 [Gossypium darwinii]|uniref:Uncharacterized protein n=1 Tax=Gossypium darwinii TaxID=34276 RepID=A0A5D2HMU5_GOSDA|nr:hypothetical protein ES288_A01G186300v1 [Gossypium darwinii]
MQLGSHYRNSNCSFGDTDISYNIGREDIWDAKVSYLDDGFPHEREDDISWKYWSHKIDGNSGDFLDYENGHMPDNAFEGHHMLRKMLAINSITQPGWPFFETEDPKDSLSLVRTQVLHKSKATKRASYCLQGEIELYQKWLFEEECNSVNIDLGFSSSHCTSQANFPSVGSQLWAGHPIGAFLIPELNLDVTSEKFSFCQPLNDTNSFDSSYREIGFPNLSLIQGQINGDDKRKLKSPPANCEQLEFKMENYLGNDLLFSKELIGSHGVETSSSVKIHEKGESKGYECDVEIPLPCQSEIE